jgi:ribosome-associated protein
MDIRKLQRAIVDGLEDVKAQNIVVFNTEHLTPLFERVIIATGTSNRQTKSLASSVRDAVKEHGFQVLRTEGEANGEWIIVDCGAAVVHVMQPSIRDYYHLEEIWGDKPVHMKIGKAGPTRLVKAEEAEGPHAAAVRAGKATAKRATAKNATVKKPAAKKAAAKAPAAAAGRGAASARPAPGRMAKAAGTAATRGHTPPAGQAAGKAKAPARKVAPSAAKPGVTRVVGVKRAATTRPPAARQAASATAAKAPARKVAARKTGTRK